MRRASCPHEMKLVELYKNNIEKIKYLSKLALVIIVYGFLLNIPMHFIFKMQFSLFTVFGWGILVYFVKFEFPKLWSQLFPRK